MNILRKLRRTWDQASTKITYLLCRRSHEELQQIVLKLSKNQEAILSELETKDAQIYELARATTVLIVTSHSAARVLEKESHAAQEVREILQEGETLGRETLDKIDDARQTKHDTHLEQARQ